MDSGEGCAQRQLSILVTELAENWIQRGELHRELAFRLANDALKALRKGPKLDNWQDIERADKIARRAAGLESEEATKVNVSLNLVNQRILAMQQEAPD